MEFAELVLFLASWIRARFADAAIALAGRVGTAARWIAVRTDLDSEDVAVALWIAIGIGTALVLAALLAALF